MREVSRHGRVCWYFRKDDGRRIRLPDVGAPSFMRAYKAAFNASSGQKIGKILRDQQAKRTYVYFMLAKNRVKIGFSNDPKKRAAEMQTAVPERLEIVLKIKGGRELEREMHARFQDLRLGGEWFAYHGALADFIHGREEVDLVL